MSSLALRACVSELGACLYLWPRDDASTQRLAARISEEVVSLVRKKDWTALRRLFNPMLRIVVTEALLRKGVESMTATAGALLETGPAVISINWVTTICMSLHFATTRLGLKITINIWGQLIGLRFGPQSASGLGDSWHPPAYCNEDSFEEVEVKSRNAKSRVGGTLTLPSGRMQCPCAILLPGSGSVDRDSSVGAAKPLRDVACGLAAHGIASLRFDKPGHVHVMKAVASRTYTPSLEYVDCALDALSIALESDRISKDSLFLLGYSLGGVVAPHIVATEPNFAGCIVMAGPANQAYYHAAIRQTRYLTAMANKIPGVDGEQPPQHVQSEALTLLQRQADAADHPDLSPSTRSWELPFGLPASYWLDLREFDPIKTCNELCMRKPILVLQGARDYQVTVDDDYRQWQNALKGRSNVTMHEYDNLNHLFISGEGPSLPLEYDTPGSVDETVIRDLSGWIWQVSRRNQD